MNKNFIKILVVLLVAVTILGANTYLQKEKLNENGVITTAVIEEIIWNKYSNDAGNSVDNIHVKYKYEVEGREFIRTQEVLRQEHDLYFDTTKNVGDSIYIKYLENNPKHSRIEKMVQSAK
ncbi:DUF3592 domain-containing protein [Aquimarina sp. D1M17]|uniref:DUF3592 domain-containing protein n=1 Tax=Aquimarina acroporae TaxID=2937283 RepID=UPI0020BE687C|nr:DUF3592 domain-containing protein [Aquimarina acroporae]MCK8522499.1 DUF3592 domain-containing protein [Aquimarina acroporae]